MTRAKAAGKAPEGEPSIPEAPEGYIVVRNITQEPFNVELHDAEGNPVSVSIEPESYGLWPSCYAHLVAKQPRLEQV